MTDYPATSVEAQRDESVWRRLAGLVADVPGWSPTEELFALYQLALAGAPAAGDVLEIGSWCGRSTVALAWGCGGEAARKVFACDLFPDRDDWRQNADGTYSFSVAIGGRRLGAYESQTVWREPFERDIAPLYRDEKSLLALFHRTMARYGVADRVQPVRGDSAALVESLTAAQRFGLVFIDGDHGFDAVCRDIANVEPYLLPGGWIAFDDAFTSYAGVDRAIRERICANPRYKSGTQLTRKLFAARRVG